jgi:anaerobic ribonucleoside-triphosphate reductase activating protein
MNITNEEVFKLNYAAIKTCDVANGTGVRVVLFVSGCSHHCEGCHNPETWDPQYGQPFTETEQDRIYCQLKKPFISGITISGGDPLYRENLSDIYKLVSDIRCKFPDKNIWCYTGYTFEQIFKADDEDNKVRQQIIKLCDVLVDGPFILKERNITLKWKGSPNQRVINIPSTLSNNCQIHLLA